LNLPHMIDYGKFTCTPIYEERLLLAMPLANKTVREHLRECKYSGGYPVASLDMLEKIPFIATRPGMNLTVEVKHLFEQKHIEPVVLLETGNLTTAINLVAKGVGYTFVPEGGAHVCMRPEKVEYFAVDTPECAWTLAAVYRRDVYVSNLVRLFVEELKEIYKGR